MEKNNKIVFGIIALVFLLAFVISGFGDTTGAFHRINPDPDLQITEVKEITSDDITLTIYNDGTGTTTSFTTTFYKKVGSDWQEIGSRYSNKLKGERTETFTHTWSKALYEDAVIKIVVDSGNKIEEMNEGNNEWVETFSF